MAKCSRDLIDDSTPLLQFQFHFRLQHAHQDAITDRKLASIEALGEQDETFPDQKGRPTQRPTAKWVFHAFVGIHVLLGVTDKPLILNLQAHHLRLLKVMGVDYESLYS